jgi:hypothetical protein
MLATFQKRGQLLTWEIISDSLETFWCEDQCFWLEWGSMACLGLLLKCFILVNFSRDKEENITQKKHAHFFVSLIASVRGHTTYTTYNNTP